MNKSNGGFWAVIVIAAIVGVGYLFYKNNQSKIDTTVKGGKFLGIF